MFHSDIPLSFKNVLPRLWYLMLIKDNFIKKTTKEYYDFSGNAVFQFNNILNKMDDSPDDGAQKLHSNVCSYCNNDYTFNAKGDHVVNGNIHKKYRELDNLVYRLNCCKSCNSSKLDKDMIDWWVNYKKKNITTLTKNHLNVYCRAMWMYCKLSNSLDDLVPEYYLKAIEQLRQVINNKTYDKIWQNNDSGESKPSSLDVFIKK
jgi:hypothetical protein